MDATCPAHLRFLEKVSSQVEPSLVLFPQGPAGGVEVWTADTLGSGFRDPNLSQMHQDPVASQTSGASPVQGFLSWRGKLRPRVAEGWQALGSGVCSH